MINALDNDEFYKTGVKTIDVKNGNLYIEGFCYSENDSIEKYSHIERKLIFGNDKLVFEFPMGSRIDESFPINAARIFASKYDCPPSLIYVPSGCYQLALSFKTRYQHKIVRLSAGRSISKIINENGSSYKFFLKNKYLAMVKA